MNDKLDLVRRRITAKMDDMQWKQLKGLRFIFLRNNEDLPEDAKLILKNMRGDFQDLGDAYMFKEALRSIYRQAKDSYHARIAFHRWCKLAEETGIPELKTMAKTIRDKLDGIVTYWTFRHISNAKMEGFNNKIRWLIKQAYGFRDREYFKLKIYQLPEISSSKGIWSFVTNHRWGKNNESSHTWLNSWEFFNGGRYGTRTHDLCRVKAAL